LTAVSQVITRGHSGYTLLLDWLGLRSEIYLTTSGLAFEAICHDEPAGSGQTGLELK